MYIRGIGVHVHTGCPILGWFLSMVSRLLLKVDSCGFQETLANFFNTNSYVETEIKNALWVVFELGSEM